MASRRPRRRRAPSTWIRARSSRPGRGPIPTPKPSRAPRSAGPATVLVSSGVAGSPGVAVMREEVSRAEYAAVRQQHRSAQRAMSQSACADRDEEAQLGGARIHADRRSSRRLRQLRGRRAYAQWLSQRTGETFRLPTVTEWRQIASYKGSGDACQGWSDRLRPERNRASRAKARQARWGSTACAATHANG